MTLKIIIAMACVGAYPLLVTIGGWFGGIAGRDGIDQSLYALIYSIFLCVFFFIVSFFISRWAFGSAWWAILFVALGVTVTWGIMVVLSPEDTPHTSEWTDEKGEKQKVEYGWFGENVLTCYRADGSVKRIEVRKNSLWVSYRCFYPNGEVEREFYFADERKRLETAKILSKKRFRESRDIFYGNPPRRSEK